MVCKFEKILKFDVVRYIRGEIKYPLYIIRSTLYEFSGAKSTGKEIVYKKLNSPQNLNDILFLKQFGFDEFVSVLSMSTQLILANSLLIQSILARTEKTITTDRVLSYLFVTTYECMYKFFTNPRVPIPLTLGYKCSADFIRAHQDSWYLGVPAFRPL